jgi:hypothetical protein
MKLFDIGLADNNIEVTDPNEFIKPPKSGLDYRFVDVLPTYRIESNEPDLVVTDKVPLLIIHSDINTSINGNYICMNPDPTFVRPGERYKPMEVSKGKFNDNTVRIWKCENGSSIEHVYMDNGNDSCPQYWVIYDKDHTPVFKARDGIGVHAIWDLKWIKVEDDASDNSLKNAATLTPVIVEINTAGEFLARRVAYTVHIQDRNFLQRVTKLYLNKDLVLDGVNIK